MIDGIVIIFGMIIGSFLNVCIYRIPKGESIVFPGSHCMSCGHNLGPLDLFPVLSYLFLRGKCRYCKTRISPRYMIVELSTGIIFWLCYMQSGLSLVTLMCMSFCSVLIVLSLIDLDHMILPTSVIIFGGIIGIGFRVALSVFNHEWAYLWDGLIAAAVGYGFFYLVYIIAPKIMHKEGLGFGDVRVMGMLGIYVGLEQLFVMLVIACLMAIVVGSVLLAIRKKSEAYPFGPYLCGATMMMLIWGGQIMCGYRNLLGL